LRFFIHHARCSGSGSIVKTVSTLPGTICSPA
jgi:hypothetical protein